jgi:phthiocerol/phenolphthiocerol synthesis type-I polyketide synthase E
MAGSIQNAELRVAVVGMSVRLPGARTLREFWENLCCGVESITFFSREDLVAASIDPALVNHPNYVPARAILPDLEEFDSAFFGLSPREAALVDPQQRVLLECAWEALEDSGCTREAESRLCGVYAGTGVNGYLLHNIWTDRSLFESIGGFQIMLGNDKDFCATRISYKLNLNGPSLSVQTACSTSLVAVHLACQALLQGECDLALAGGCSAFVPQRSGYMYEQGMILSPDGHCRPFDAQASGTVPGSGAAMIVLKRLEDALKDRDCIQAVILGSAINNDGAVKMGYTAPSAKGQRDVISEALSVAGASPDSIGYIEAHGTGTPNGDPIEFEALNQVFGSSAAASGKCVLSALKSNFGHLDVAAGVVGLIKAILALKNGVIPGTLHFERPNTQISFEQSAFFVPTRPAPWDPARCSPRRAGVSSFGIGGTNAHVVLEEAPSVDEYARSSRRHQAFVVSAKSAAALAAAEQHLIDYLRDHPDCDVADVAFTLNTVLRLFTFRRLVTAADREEAIAQLVQVSSSKDHI